MKNFLFLFSLLFVLSIQSCSKDNYDEVNNALVGSWKLTAWNVEGGFDINSDGVADINLLSEIDCPNEETLVFESNGTVSSDKTFNPKLQIALIDEVNETYSFNVECPEGVIGFSASYSLNNGALTIQDRMASLNGNQLTRVFEDAIKIYNEDFTQVIATKTLTMVYTKE